MHIAKAYGDETKSWNLKFKALVNIYDRDLIH